MNIFTSAATIRVWDLPTRFFHWLLVLLIALLYLSGEFGLLPMQWHAWLGYATLALVMFRVLWGFTGSQTSRFENFVYGPRMVLRYVIDSLRGRWVRVPGHNPLGGWSVLLLLMTVMVQTISGLFSSDDMSEEGLFAAYVSNATVKLMTRIHHLGHIVLLALIVTHIAAVLLYLLVRKDNLVRPMLSGRAYFENAPSLRFVSAWLAFVLLALSAGVVWALVVWGTAAGR
ncbi:MAG: cytochrome b/b6 domain-containing protein [Rhodanobacter sp.]|jgi:cytochrome b|nr:cytochrome b/b6 domain-containing protein [Rhodanobacter sp.]